MPDNSRKEPRKPKLYQALIPVVLLMFFLAVSIIKFGASPHVPLIGGTTIAAILAALLGYSWDEIEGGLIHGIVLALKACLILLIIGTLIGT